MKTASLRPAKTCAIAMLISSFSLLVSCSESENSYQVAPLTGTWTMSNSTVINSEDGIPRQPGNLLSLNQKLRLSDEGTYFGDAGENIVNGKWSTRNDNLFVSLDDGQTMLLKISELQAGKLTLIQPYESDGTFASGIICYNFDKN